MKTWDVIYEYCNQHPNCTDTSCERTVFVHSFSVPEINLITDGLSAQGGSVRRLTFRMPLPVSQFLGLMFLALGIGGILGPMVPSLRMETNYLLSRIKASRSDILAAQAPPLPKSAPVVFEPLVDEAGAPITPVNTDFSLVIPKIGVNAAVIANVDPAKPAEYKEALLQGVAHASTSFTPDQNGTVYLFSHSTNYEWFVKDLNAIFYLVKNLEKGDSIVLFYQGKRYTYRLTDKKVVKPSNVSYLVPTAGKKSLILQTCWPPGSVAERLLIFADLVETASTPI